MDQKCGRPHPERGMGPGRGPSWGRTVFAIFPVQKPFSLYYFPHVPVVVPDGSNGGGLSGTPGPEFTAYSCASTARRERWFLKTSPPKALNCPGWHLSTPEPSQAVSVAYRSRLACVRGPVTGCSLLLHMRFPELSHGTFCSTGGACRRRPPARLGSI